MYEFMMLVVILALGPLAFHVALNIAYVVIGVLWFMVKIPFKITKALFEPSKEQSKDDELKSLFTSKMTK